MHFNWLQIRIGCIFFLGIQHLQAQNITQKTIPLDRVVISTRFGYGGSTLYCFSDDGNELYALRDRLVDNYYPHTVENGYTFYDLNEVAADDITIYNAETGSWVDDFQKEKLFTTSIGRKIQYSIDKYCYLSSDFECNEQEFEKHRTIYYDRLPKGWVNPAQKIKLNYNPMACQRRHLSADSTLRIALINVVDAKQESLVAEIPNIQLFPNQDALREFNNWFTNYSYNQEDWKLSKKQMREMSGTEIKNTRVVYDAATQTGYIVLYISSSYRYWADKTLVKILRFSFKEGSWEEVYRSPIYSNEHFDHAGGKLRLASKDLLTNSYFLHYRKPYKYESGNKSQAQVDLIKFNAPTDSNSVVVYDLTPNEELKSMITPDQLGHKDFNVLGVSGDTVLYSHYDDLKIFENNFFHVNYKTGKVLSNWLPRSFHGAESAGSAWLFFSPKLNKMGAEQRVKVKDTWWSGVIIMDFDQQKLVDCDQLQNQLAEYRNTQNRIIADEKASEVRRQAREAKEAELQRLLQENARLGTLLGSNRQQSGNTCGMCNGTGRVEKFGTHLDRVAYTDSQGRLIYHNVETTTGSYFETCPRCKGSGRN